MTDEENAKPKLLGDGSEVEWLDSSTVDDSTKRSFGERLIDGVRKAGAAIVESMQPLESCTICHGNHHPMSCPDKPKAQKGLRSIYRTLGRRHSSGRIFGEGSCQVCGAGPDLPCDYHL